MRGRIGQWHGQKIPGAQGEGNATVGS
jgi:hypothetical protein